MKDFEYDRAFAALKIVLDAQPNVLVPTTVRETGGQALAETVWAFIRTYQSQYEKEVQKISR